MKLIVEPGGDTPLCSLHIAFRGGIHVDPAGWEGLSRHATELARRGTRSLDRAALDEKIDHLGASLDPSYDRDQCGLSAICLSRHVDELVDIAIEILTEPAQEPEQHDKLSRESSAGLMAIRDDDGSLAARFFTRHVYPGSNHARSGLGTVDSLGRIAAGLERVTDRWTQIVSPQELFVGIAGAISEERAHDIAGRIHAAIVDRTNGATTASPDSPEAPVGRRVLLVDKPDRAQAHMLFGHPAPAYGSEGFPALLLAETAFGGMFSSRLVQVIRVENGWSYGVGSQLGRGRDPLWLSCDLAPSIADASAALGRALELFEAYAEDGPTKDEFELAQQYLVGSLPFAEATPRQRMENRLRLALYDLADDHARRIVARIGTLSREDVREAARQALHPEDLAITVVATTADLDRDFANERFGAVEIVNWQSY